VPVFPRVSALLGYEFRRVAAIQVNTLGGVPHGQPGELGRVAERKTQVLTGVPSGRRHPPRHQSTGCSFVIGDVILRQSQVLFVVPCIQTLVRRQMPAVQRRMLLGMAVFDRRVLRDVRSEFLFFRCLVGHIDHSSFY
jgi:hypothetical protein